MKYKWWYDVKAFFWSFGSIVPESINVFMFLEKILSIFKDFNFLSKK